MGSFILIQYDQKLRVHFSTFLCNTNKFIQSKQHVQSNIVQVISLITLNKLNTLFWCFSDQFYENIGVYFQLGLNFLEIYGNWFCCSSDFTEIYSFNLSTIRSFSFYHKQIIQDLSFWNLPWYQNIFVFHKTATCNHTFVTLQSRETNR